MRISFDFDTVESAIKFLAQFATGPQETIGGPAFPFELNVQGGQSAPAPTAPAKPVRAKKTKQPAASTPAPAADKYEVPPLVEVTDAVERLVAAKGLEPAIKVLEGFKVRRVAELAPTQYRDAIAAFNKAAE